MELKDLPKSWAVRNDGSLEFKKVIDYLKILGLKDDHYVSSDNHYYGVDDTGYPKRESCVSGFLGFVKLLSVNGFIYRFNNKTNFYKGQNVCITDSGQHLSGFSKQRMYIWGHTKSKSPKNGEHGVIRTILDYKDGDGNDHFSGHGVAMIDMDNGSKVAIITNGIEDSNASVREVKYNSDPQKSNGKRPHHIVNEGLSLYGDRQYGKLHDRSLKQVYEWKLQGSPRRSASINLDNYIPEPNYDYIAAMGMAMLTSGENKTKKNKSEIPMLKLKSRV